MTPDQSVRPLTDLTENVLDFLAELRQTSGPVLLTVAGKAELVVQDPQSYQRLLDQIERFETREAIREGLASIERGEGRPAVQFFTELHRRLYAQASRT